MKTDRDYLREANGLIRSFNSVVERRGVDTNWEALENEVKRVLKEHHPLKLFSIPVVSNHVKNANCETCKSCELYENENASLSNKYICKQTEDFIPDIYEHFCDNYERE